MCRFQEVYGGVGRRGATKIVSSGNSQPDGESLSGLGLGSEQCELDGSREREARCPAAAGSGGQELEGEWNGGGVPTGSRRLQAAACLGFEGETIKQLPDFKRLNEKALYFSLRPLTTNLEPPGRRGPPCLELWNCKSGPSAFFQALHLCPKPQGSLHPSQKTGMHGSSA